jgi:hypothetical protein
VELNLVGFFDSFKIEFLIFDAMHGNASERCPAAT